MNLTLRVWRQANTQTKGTLVDYQAKDVSPDSSFLEMLDELNEEERTVRLRVEGERLYVPINGFFGGRLRETFTRVSAEAVVERHPPCTRSGLEGGHGPT